MNPRSRIAGASLAVLAGVLVGGCGSSADAEPQALTPIETVEATAPTAVPTAQPAANTLAPSEVFLAFAGAWDSADWDRMGTLASPNVIEVAKEWRSDGGDASTGMAYALDSCVVGGPGQGGCSILYAPPDGFALIFQLQYTMTDTGPMITELTFGGDAG